MTQTWPIMPSCTQTRYTGTGDKQVVQAGSVGVSILRTQATSVLKVSLFLLDQEVRNYETESVGGPSSCHRVTISAARESGTNTQREEKICNLERQRI